MNRIGYVGLSTPSFYDYHFSASKAPSDQSSSPNPIIEGAFGALLLYDELWFLCRSLCPENMRGLPYVKFLDELGMVPDIDPEWLPEPESMFQAEAVAKFRESSSAYADVKAGARVYWDAAADNHTHGLKVGDQILSGNSWSLKNVLYDLLLVERLPQAVELITNSFSSRLFSDEARVGDRLKLTELLLLDGVPQFLSFHGPYHPCVEEVRDSSYMSYFRKWIVRDASSASNSEVAEIKMEIESKLAETQRDHLLKYLDPKGSYRSLADTFVGVGVDLLVPGAATVKDLMGQRNEEKSKQGIRWQGFILDARRKIANSNSNYN